MTVFDKVAFVVVECPVILGKNIAEPKTNCLHGILKLNFSLLNEKVDNKKDKAKHLRNNLSGSKKENSST